MLIPENLSQRRKNRIFAVQFLYSWAVNSIDEIANLSDAIATFSEKFFQSDATNYDFGKELAEGAVSNLDVIDELIKKHATHWTLERIATVDLAILRIAIYEMLFRNDVPPIVAINEAIDIGKAMSSEESGKFLNGVLEGVKKELNRPLRHAGF